MSHAGTCSARGPKQTRKREPETVRLADLEERLDGLRDLLPYEELLYLGQTVREDLAELIDAGKVSPDCVPCSLVDDLVEKTFDDLLPVLDWSGWADLLRELLPELYRDRQGVPCPALYYSEAKFQALLDRGRLKLTLFHPGDAEQPDDVGAPAFEHSRNGRANKAPLVYFPLRPLARLPAREDGQQAEEDDFDDLAPGPVTEWLPIRTLAELPPLTGAERRACEEALARTRHQGPPEGGPEAGRGLSGFLRASGSPVEGARLKARAARLKSRSPWGKSLSRRRKRVQS